MSDPGSTPDFDAVKNRQQQTWAAGNYAVFAAPFMIVSETLCEAVDLRAGSRVLDVACGSGNTAIAAARRFCDVTGTDYVPALLAHGRKRAAAEFLDVTFVEGDAEALPFDDASFDAVLSTFGVMFAPNQERAAAELLRVCRPGGTIGLANWPPESIPARMFRLIASYMPPPPGLAPLARWGTTTGLRDLLGDGVTALDIQPRVFIARHRTPGHWLSFFRDYFGPVHAASETLESETRERFMAELLDLFTRDNQATDGTLVLPYAYLEVVATRA